jgi:general secretion pathway protein K
MPTGKLFRDDRGFALILTILIVSLLVAFTLQFNRNVRSDLHAATALRDDTRLAAAARSGFDYSLAVLLQDRRRGTVDTLNELWAKAPALSAGASLLFDSVRVELEIRDHSGRLAINRLVRPGGEIDFRQREILRRLLSADRFGLHTEEVEDLLDALQDWMDPDDAVTRFGAENAYYQSLARPYACRNGPLQSLEELLLVRGFAEELFYGTEAKPGLSRYLSVYGNGKININTAEPAVLYALADGVGPQAVADIVACREDQTRDLSNPAWYRTIPGLGHISIDPALIVAKSTYFEIVSTGLIGNRRRLVRGVVKRNSDGSAEILSWQAQ